MLFVCCVAGNEMRNEGEALLIHLHWGGVRRASRRKFESLLKREARRWTPDTVECGCSSANSKDFVLRRVEV